MKRDIRFPMWLYRFLTNVGAPIIKLYLRHRRAIGKEDSERFDERLGIASTKRPSGKLIWCHAASVGEAMSVLSLLSAIKTNHPNSPILFTTGTVTSARMLTDRLPEGIIHQYAPVDRWPYVTRFLDHWKPELALWVESELWPNMLTCLKQRKIPAVLLNGHLSERSFKQWSMVKCSVKKILEVFVLSFAQTEIERNRFAVLGANDVHCIGNLKYAAEPLPFNQNELTLLKSKIGNRKTWLMASTHYGEDEIALDVHKKLIVRWPDLLTIIVPRHPTRGEAIANLISQHGLICVRRSQHENITPKTQIYLADTMGELGLFYRLSPISCVGGSFVWGGHNPIEPAQLSSAIIFGPRMTNFAEIASELTAQGAAIQVQSADNLAATVESFFACPEDASMMADAAQAVARKKQGILKEVLQLLEPLLNMESIP